MENLKNELTVKPSKTSGGELFGKIFIGLIIGAIISALLFIILTTIGGKLTDDMSSNNPILPLLLILSGFIVSFFGNIGIELLYSLFFSKKYGNISKSIGVLLLTNGLLFIFFLPIYIIFKGSINVLFIILGFHIILATFLSSQQIENIENPNYSASALVGNTLSLAIIVLVYGIIRKTSSTSEIQNQLYLLLLFPPIIAFGIMPIGLGIRDTIYYKFFEMGNNGFYAASKGELNEKEIKDLEKEESLNEIEDDINIDLK